MKTTGPGQYAFIDEYGSDVKTRVGEASIKKKNNYDHKLSVQAVSDYKVVQGASCITRPPAVTDKENEEIDLRIQHT